VRIDICGGGFRIVPPHFLHCREGLRIVCLDLRILVEGGSDGLDSSGEQGSVGLRLAA